MSADTQNNFEREDRFAGNDWTLESKISVVDEATEAVRARLIAAGWIEEEIGTFYMAIDEAIANAVIHGNFGVHKEKGEDFELYTERIKEAEGNKDNREKKVSVHLEITPEEATVTVFDEGAGFDPEKVADPTEEDALLKTSSKGIFIIKRYVDRFEFLPPNGVRLYKKRTSGALPS